MTTSSCIICSNPSHKLKSSNGYDLYKCTCIGLEFCAPMPSEKELAGFYEEYFAIHTTRDVTTINAERNLYQFPKRTIAAPNRAVRLT